MSKILDTRILLGYMWRDETRKRFALGATLLYLVNATYFHFDIVSETHLALMHLDEQFGETVHLKLYPDN
ncbi:hypothetical protein HW423_01610 [Aerococcaceae bacterium INB8]|uniref:Uncharacterized protein n=1 Tax=Ruoffia halotolerans TaxID=2748684 RepID=A0A839A4C1_9LACT|nr:hypothetical protein [Ruoffia halotolerans]MBA5728485.1 hypothetical protein [Ruoffia halotolerans]